MRTTVRKLWETARYAGGYNDHHGGLRNLLNGKLYGWWMDEVACSRYYEAEEQGLRPAECAAAAKAAKPTLSDLFWMAMAALRLSAAADFVVELAAELTHRRA